MTHNLYKIIQVSLNYGKNSLIIKLSSMNLVL